MHAPGRIPQPSAPHRQWASRAVRSLGLVLVGLLAGALLVVVVRDYALLWVVMLPAGLWAVANRSTVLATGGRGFDLSQAPTADVVAMTIGVLLAVPAALTALDGSPWRAAVLVAVLAVLGYGVLGYAHVITQGVTRVPGAVVHAPLVARLLDASLRGLRTSSGLTNLYLAAVGTRLAFADAPDWWPAVAVLGTAALHSVLDCRRHPVRAGAAASSEPAAV